ncbi:MAG: GNAT family protein [Comamonas sp.]|uniref:GNAT family N-acetyltransferase n=1 Tax=Comamonas sp. TaxID=34028 RepID=UPI002FCBA4E5
MKYHLREIEKKDIPSINEWRNNREIINYLGAPFRYINKDVDEAWYSSYINNRNSSVRLAIVEDHSDGIIGAVYLTSIDWVNRSAEFSIWIGAIDYQSKGVGKFASHHMLSHAFNDIGMQRIHLTVLSDNTRARNLYKNVGFKEEGVLRKVILKNGIYKDMILMSILAQEFTATI